MKARVLETLKLRDELTYEIYDLIGYPKGFAKAPLSDWLNGYWRLSGESLYLGATEDLLFDDYVVYTISSMGALGEKFFMGEKDSLMFVMGYSEEDGWDSSVIFILDKEKQRI